MITIDHSLPSWVAAFEVTGHVTKEDYETVVSPVVERIYKEHGHIHLLLHLRTPVQEYSGQAWLKDVGLTIRHFAHWRKIAIVSDQAAVQKISSAFSFAIPGKTRGFGPDELEEAKRWVATEVD